jgi:hypothetical protein
MKLAIWEDVLIIFRHFLLVIFLENRFVYIEKLPKDPRKMRNEFSLV